jgi:hypothetical protein
MNALAFKYGLEKDIYQEILAWSEHTLQKPNPYFNNLPACPYAKKAWSEGRVAVLFKSEDSYQTVYSTISQFDDAFDLVIVVDLAYKKDPEEFHDYLEQMNEVISRGIFIDRDVWLMGFHPHDDENDYLDETTFEQLVSDEYAMIFIQRLSKVYKSSQQLKALGYYEEYAKDYDVETIFAQRETLYRRLIDGDET